MKDIKEYKPKNKSIGSGQVLHCPYDWEKARLIIKEMTELLSLDLVKKRVVTDQIVLTVGYDIENLANPEINAKYKGEIIKDYYGRKVPKYAHGTANIKKHTSSAMLMIDAVMALYDQIVDKNLLIRRVNISANHIISENLIFNKNEYEQIEFFTDYMQIEKNKKQEEKDLKKERAIQEATIEIKDKYGKNAIMKGYNLCEGATTIERNKQIGGHKA